MSIPNQPTKQMNEEWFKENEDYIQKQARLEGYHRIKQIVEHEVRGTKNLLDVGNGGFFNYDTSLAGHVTAVDLFLEDGPGPTLNSVLCKGSFLTIPCADESFDCILQQNTLHHVTGRTPKENHENMHRCLSEMHRCLAPDGKAIVIESTVGPLFHTFESLVYQLLLWIKRGGHPVTFQFTPQQIMQAAEASGFIVEEFTYVPRGNFIIQFGYVWPCVLTPARPIKLVLRRPVAAGK